jgi:hypothetical protein
LKVNIRRPLGEIVGEAEAASLYGGHSDLSKTMLRFAAYLCQKCQIQLATVDRPQREELCADALRRAVDRIVVTNRNIKINNLPAYITGMLKNASALGDIIGDDSVDELRHRTPTRSRDGGEGDLETLGSGVRDIVSSVPHGGAA